MRRNTSLGLLLLVCACNAQIGGAIDPTTDGGADDATSIDDAVSPPGDTTQPLGAWGAPLLVPGANTLANEDDGTLSSTTLEIVFAAEDPADDNNKRLFYMSRPTVGGAWSARVRLVPQNGFTDQTPRFSANDLTLYFGSDRAGTTGGLDIFQITRPTVGGTWGAPTLVPGVNSAQTEKWYMPCDGGRYLLISSRGGNGEDVYEGVLGAGAPVRVAALSTNAGETGTFLTPDCLTAYFASARSGDNRIYITTRPAVGMPWAAPTVVTDFMPVANQDQEDPWMSADGRTFMLSSNKSGSKDVYISTR